MLPLFDLMMQAQNGKAVEAFSSQLGVAQEQAAKAFAALLPAFSTGLKRSSANPYDFTQLMQSLMSGNYAKYFEDISAAFSPQGIHDGNDFMKNIFGSKDVSRAVAEQAAQATGIAQDMLQAMMPAMASAVAGGIMKEMTGQVQSFTKTLAKNNPMMSAMTQWMEAAGFQPKPKQLELQENPYLQMMQAMFGAQGQKSAPKIDPADPFGAGAFMKAMQSFMTPPSAEQPKSEPEPENKPVDLSKYTELVNSMFDSGLEVQKSYQKSMEAILDAYVKGGTGKNG